MTPANLSFFRASNLLPIFATVAIVALVGTALWQDRIKTLATVNALSLELAQSMANSLEESLTAMEIVALAGRKLIQPEMNRPTPDREIIESFFLDLATTLPWINGIGVFDANGDNIAVVSRVDGVYESFESTFSVANNPSFQFHSAMTEDKPFISFPAPAPSGRPQFGVSRRIVTEDGQFAGMITVVIPVAYVRSLFEEILPEENTTATVFYDDSTWLVSTREDVGVSGQRYPNITLFRNLKPEVFSGTYEHDEVVTGFRRMIAFTRLGDFPFIVAVGRNKHEVLAGWSTSVLWYSAAVLLVIALATLLSRRISHSVEVAEDQRRFLQDTLNAIPNPIYIKDDKSRYVMVNRMFADRLQVSEEEMAGKTVHDLGLSGEGTVSIEEYDQSVIEKGVAQTRVRKNHFHKGRAGFEWMQITKIPFKDHKGASYLIGTSTDVTELKRREAHDAQRQKLEALGRLAGGIAHEINNALQPILVYAQMGKEDMAKEPDRPSGSYFATIQTATDKASTLLSGMLAFARQVPSDTEVVDLNESIADALKFLEPLKPIHVTFSANYAPHPLLCRIDPDGLTQVLTNMLINAFHAMGERGSITVSVSEAEPHDQATLRDEFPKGPCARIVISDTGPGIPEDVISHVFEPFYTTKDIGEGTGLGMSIALGLVRDWDGTIEVRSEPGQGATFTILLPLVAATAEAAAE